MTNKYNQELRDFNLMVNCIAVNNLFNETKTKKLFIYLETKYVYDIINHNINNNYRLANFNEIKKFIKKEYKNKFSLLNVMDGPDA